MQRTQIYLSKNQHAQLKTLAQKRGVTSSAVIRDAIDSYLTQQHDPQERLQKLKTLAAHLSSTATTDHADSTTEVEALRQLDAARLNSHRAR